MPDAQLCKHCRAELPWADVDRIVGACRACGTPFDFSVVRVEDAWGKDAVAPSTASPMVPYRVVVPALAKLRRPVDLLTEIEEEATASYRVQAHDDRIVLVRELRLIPAALSARAVAGLVVLALGVVATFVVVLRLLHGPIVVALLVAFVSMLLHIAFARWAFARMGPSSRPGAELVRLGRAEIVSFLGHGPPVRVETDEVAEVSLEERLVADGAGADGVVRFARLGTIVVRTRHGESIVFVRESRDVARQRWLAALLDQHVRSGLSSDDRA